MCNGDCVIRYIDPERRAPFRAVIGPIGNVLPCTLEDSWCTFYTKFTEYASQDYGLHNLAQESGLIYYNQDFIFDSYFDLANKNPELFSEMRDRELYEMYKSEGLLEISPTMYKKWVAEKQAKIKAKYRYQFCFDDLKQSEK